MPEQLYVVGFVRSMKTQLFAEVGERPVYGCRIDMGSRKYASTLPRAQAQSVASVLCAARPEIAGKLFIEEAQ